MSWAVTNITKVLGDFLDSLDRAVFRYSFHEFYRNKSPFRWLSFQIRDDLQSITLVFHYLYGYRKRHKCGSIPDEALAIMEMVPVGAIVVTVAFRISHICSLSIEGSFKIREMCLFGWPGPLDASCPSLLINFITFSPNSRACLEL